MKKEDTINTLVLNNPNAYFVSTCGYISRDLYNIHDSERNFYMVGSMGMAAPVALGIAIDNPNIEVIILDGDGSLLMNMGFMTMIGESKQPNLNHIVLNNQVHESTGGQKTLPLKNICNVAKNLGYANGKEINSLNNIPNMKKINGPNLFHIKVQEKEESIGERVHWTPQEIVGRFQNSLLKEREVT